MAVIPNPPGNTGPQRTAVQSVVDESLLHANEFSSVATPGFNASSAQTGVADLVSDIGVSITSALPAIPDLSLTAGINTDTLFDLGGQSNSIFGDLSLSQLPGNLTGIFGSEFSIDQIADQFGIGGLLGNLPISINTDVAPALDPQRNVLHQYASHTYRITMGAQDVNDHQATQSEDFIIGTPKITSMLMSSGGAHAVDCVTRDPIFEEDFYIEDLKIHTIIGNNEQGSGSNAVAIEFTIVEPYAVSLIERLLALAEKLGYVNYIEIPYIFKIEFIGYDDEGNVIGVVPQTTKYIPFRLTYMKFEVAGTGSAYQCTAIPVNHFTFNQTVSAIPEEIEINATKVGEFFNGKSVGPPGGGHTEGGFVDAINAFHSNLASKTGVDTPKNANPRNAADVVKIIIHPELAEHKLEVGNLANVGMIKEGFGGNAHMDPTKPKYGFHAGTAIEKVISKIIESSTFATQQVEEHERIDKANNLAGGAAARGGGYPPQPKKKDPIITVKITSSYKMLAYDSRANRHAYEATYYVSPYASPGHQSATLGRSEITNIAKEYDYLFTGNNQDILNLDVKFDLAFYNSLATNTTSSAEASPNGADSAVTGADQGDKNPNQSGKTNPTPVEMKPGAPIDNTQTAAKDNYKKQKATALMKSIMESSKGDMITLDLEILGDPAFIKQDDILYRATSDRANAFTPNGSIKQDNGDMFIRLRFKTFDDIDHSTGLRTENIQIPNSTFARKSTFDGFYRVIMLENNFSEGRFTQNMVVIRTYVQEDEDPESDAATIMDNSLVAFIQDVGDKVAGAKAVVTGATAAVTGAVDSARETAIAGANSLVGSAVGSLGLPSLAPTGSCGPGGSPADIVSGVLGGKLSPAAAVDEAKKLAGPFYAGVTPIDAAEFVGLDETLIPDLDFTPNIESIKELTLTQSIDADRAGRRRR